MMTSRSKQIIHYCRGEGAKDAFPFRDYVGYDLELKEAEEIMQALAGCGLRRQLQFVVFLGLKNEHFAKRKENLRWLAQQLAKIKTESKKNKDTSSTLMLLSMENHLKRTCTI